MFSVNISNTSLKEKTIGFIWQHLWLIVSMFFMTFGVALCVRSNLGSGTISAIPMVFSLAGEFGKVPGWTIGGYTNIMNIILVACQILVLRKKFNPVQLLQLIVGFIFGAMLDINMAITSIISYDSLWVQICAQLLGATILGIAIAFEIRCGSVTMPGEGIQVAVSRVSGVPFPKVKIFIDTTLVVIAVFFGYVFFDRWMWEVGGPGTLFAMLYVGMVVRFINPRINWFDKILGYRPGFRRYLYGLARYIYKNRP